MADIQPTDQFLVNRSDSTQTVDHADLMAELQDTDLMLINRSDTTFKITGEDLKDSLKAPLELVAVVSPTEPSVGDTLTVTAVANGGTSPYTYTYQWYQKLGVITSWTQIAGAESSTYVIPSSQAGWAFRCEVVATDADSDFITETSNATSPAQETDSPPSVTGATLSGGPGFSGKTYTTTLVDYDPGEPAATQGMKAQVYGSLQIAAESSAITAVQDISPNTSQTWSAACTWTENSAGQGPDNAFNGTTELPMWWGKVNTTSTFTPSTPIPATSLKVIYLPLKNLILLKLTA